MQIAAAKEVLVDNKKRKVYDKEGSKDGLYDGDAHVVSLTSSSFPSKTDHFVYLVQFYSPWCRHCQELSPIWSRVARALKGIGVIKVAAVNCAEDIQLCRKHFVEGYPIIKSVVGGKTQEFSGPGETSASVLENWGLSFIPNKVVTVAKPAHVSEFLQRCSASSQSGKDTASWGVCVLLLTAKTETAPLYKILSWQYAEKIVFGEARGSNSELAKKSKVDKYPALLAFCDGDESYVQRYGGEFKSAPISSFLDEFSNRLKCASIYLNQQSGGKLKQLMKDRGIYTKDCLEKADFVEKLLQWARAVWHN